MTDQWGREWPGPAIGADEVHLIRLRTDGADPELGSLLEPAEVDRAASFRFERDRARYAISRGALRSVLARYLGRSPDEIALVDEGHGKPRLADDDEHRRIRFNVSHSGGLTVIALTAGTPVGVDVEERTAGIPHEQMAARFFSQSELERFRSIPRHERLDHFFAVWTRKEAYLKGIGAGLSVAPETITVSLDPGEPTPIVDVANEQRWWTEPFQVADGVSAALALPSHHWTSRYLEFFPFTS